MKKIFALFILASILFVDRPASALTLIFDNQSKWDIHELYFSDVDEEEWGPDQLDEDVIESGDKFTLTKISKGMYDVKIVDEDGDSCEIRDVDFNSSEHFVLDDKVLLGCQAATDMNGDDEDEDEDDEE